MQIRPVTSVPWVTLSLLVFVTCVASADESELGMSATINGSEPGWHPLGKDDFVNVNGRDDTWVWKDAILRCSGKPIGVVRSKVGYTNFELLVQWRHLQPGGNSGVFVWTSDEALQGLKADMLPSSGIEIQILDHEFARQYEESSGKKADWFTTNGDVFPVGSAKMKPFPPLSPNGDRSFPRMQLSKGVGQWNNYYIRCLNGEVRLWVNGAEVSGGTECHPCTGYLCLESEGAPVEFRALRIRELP
jgi:hypothetical protein